ncbi:MAG TPA: lipase family protein [Polyangiaceae bacterium LLY-WYZ-15_(1-7)]|nr:lipase family protein [Polyangiaceae bacterium LLY-WYZ-15_(1-7)]HJL05618.1 lipase family protein [Polyangiaceae bacterium LLY-WYZ-15_(1-7)]HJL12925.1 lipase family protein [Polyangiaceae bacterium LLY-WYZ-15_(1-7)]HJL20929.1 lipase family protein [Polyangiaceae bacterium LLY-WYZ-15_(1-7)]HJL28888.1 lipase family protein [Polyangiaceae bacterium LLY-WYZ-15_(1-7)]
MIHTSRAIHFTIPALLALALACTQAVDVDGASGALARDPSKPSAVLSGAEPAEAALVTAPIGRTTSFRLEGRLYGARIELRARPEPTGLRDVPGRETWAGARVLPTLRMSRYEDGGRWVDATLTDEVEPGLYAVEVRDGRGTLLATPVRLDATPEPTVDRSFLELRETLTDSLPLADAVLTRDGTLVAPAPVQITGHTPTSPAHVGDELVLVGENLPFASDSIWASSEGWLDLYLDGERLEGLEHGGDHLVFQLPDHPATGRLEAEIADAETGYATTVLLDADYRVEYAPAFEAFDAAAGPADGADWTQAYLLSVAAYLAYAQIPEVSQTAPDWGLTFHSSRVVNITPTFGLGHSTQAYVFTTEDALIVSFEGTQTDLNPLDGSFDNADIPTDASIQLLDLPGLCPRRCLFGFCQPVCGVDVPEVHEGFWTAADVAFPEVLAHVDALSEGRRVWVTGHSLGGALAMLTAFRLEREGVDVQGVQAFGAPLVGDMAFGGYYDATVPNTHRWVIEDDVIPGALPPPYWGMGALHRLRIDGGQDPFVDESPHLPTLDEALGHIPTPAEWWDAVFNPAGAHMSYWCRLHTELGENEDDGYTFPPPPDFGRPMCAVP